MTVAPNLIAWLDFETLGLDPLTTPVVEFAMILTDAKYNRLAGMSMTITPPGGIDWATVDPVVVAMHEESGLRRDLDERTGWSLLDAELEAVALIQEHLTGEGGQVPYAGSGVAAFDKQIIANRMPHLNPLLTYFACPDVGVLRRTFRTWGVATGWDPGPIMHRATADVERSIAEATYYRDVFTELNGMAYR